MPLSDAMKKRIGQALIAAPYVVLSVMLLVTNGLFATISVFAITALILFCFTIGIMWATGHD